jgi:hypothetical protein
VSDPDGPSPFILLGDPDALACEGDSCVVPVVSGADLGLSPDEAAAASSRAVAAALDEGAAL